MGLRINWGNFGLERYWSFQISSDKFPLMNNSNDESVLISELQGNNVEAILEKVKDAKKGANNNKTKKYSNLEGKALSDQRKADKEYIPSVAEAFEIPPKLFKGEEITDTAPTPIRFKSIASEVNYLNEVEIYDSLSETMIISFNLPNTEILTNIKNINEKPFALYQVSMKDQIADHFEVPRSVVADFKGKEEATVLSSRTVTRLFINEKDAKRLRRVLKDFYLDARFTNEKVE